MKKEVKDWLDYAGRDILSALTLINNPDLTQMVAFHCQQAIEKYFKAYLLQNAKPIIKTHDLIKLYSAVKEIKNLNIHETRLKAVDSVYVETRYPGEIGLLPNGAPTEKEAQGFLVFAREVEKIIKKELG